MKKTLLFLSLAVSISSYSQLSRLSKQTHEKCVSNSLRKHIKETLDKNQKPSRKSTEEIGHPLFIWPIQKTEYGKNFHDLWIITAHVDHNSEKNIVDENDNIITPQYNDYTGGSRSYDGHAGTDIAITPFWWLMVENEAAKVVAAAPGKIIEKIDGNYDRNCVWKEENEWNAVYLQHADGSYSLYGHMKNGSLTKKQIGDFVEEGEYLGIVASSGFSSGPHLHFEVYDKDQNLIDPYQGSNNKLNSDSWWKNQKEPRNPGILSVTIGDNYINWNDIDESGNFVCGNNEITNEKDVYALNEPIFFTHYFRDAVSEDLLKKIKVYRPDNTLAMDFTESDEELVQVSATEFKKIKELAYFYDSRTFQLINILNKDLVDMKGEWRIEVEFGDDSLVKTFKVGSTASLDDLNNLTNKTNIYPNPSNDNTIFINTNRTIKKVVICNILGKKVLEVKGNIKEINTSTLGSGIYLVSLEDENNKVKTVKYLKK